MTWMSWMINRKPALYHCKTLRFGSLDLAERNSNMFLICLISFEEREKRRQAERGRDEVQVLRNKIWDEILKGHNLYINSTRRYIETPSSPSHPGCPSLSAGIHRWEEAKWEREREREWKVCVWQAASSEMSRQNPLYLVQWKLIFQLMFTHFPSLRHREHQFTLNMGLWASNQCYIYIIINIKILFIKTNLQRCLMRCVLKAFFKK